MQLQTTYNLWCHYEKDNWKLNGYRNIYEISSAKDFWELYNNWDNIGGLLRKQYFLMKNNITPRWEDPANNMGGCWSIKLTNTDYYDIWETLSVLLVVDEISSIKDDINGISICQKKNDKVVIKIWNKSKMYSKIDNLNKLIFDEFRPDIIYIANNPE